MKSVRQERDGRQMEWSVDIYENHDRRCILFSVLGRMLSRNRHGQEKSHRIAFLSR